MHVWALVPRDRNVVAEPREFSWVSLSTNYILIACNIKIFIPVIFSWEHDYSSYIRGGSSTLSVL